MYQKEIIYLGLYKGESRMGGAGFLKVENRERESRLHLKIQNVPLGISGRFPIRVYNGNDWKEINGITVQDGKGNWEERLAENMGQTMIQVMLPGGYMLKGKSRYASDSAVQKSAEEQDNLNMQKNADRQEGIGGQERAGEKEDTGGQADVSRQSDASRQVDVSRQADAGRQESIVRREDTGRQESIDRQADVSRQNDAGRQEETIRWEDAGRQESIVRREDTGRQENIGEWESEDRQDDLVRLQNIGERSSIREDNGMDGQKNVVEPRKADERINIDVQRDANIQKRASASKTPQTILITEELPRRAPEERAPLEQNTLGYHLKEDKWEQILDTYEKIHPYGDGRVYVKIEPKDFVILQSGYQHLVNNSFLLHGFYNYRYIILGKEQDRYYLGVPGVFYEREKMVALMFGFEAFECPGGNVTAGEFGYYLRKVEL